MKYAITFREEGVEKPQYIFTETEAARTWFQRHHKNVSSLDMCIQDEHGKDYEAGFDGGYFLNQYP